MNGTTKLRIAEFPTGDDLWRIDWFGEITFPNRLLLRRHPSVNVYLSKVTDGMSLFAMQSTSREDRQRQCTISVGKLMLLRIGDIWKDQQPFEAPDYEMETFQNLLIGRETSGLVKAGLSLEDGGFLLPLTEHPGHRRNTHSYCLRVALPDGRGLVIPCMELIRFYFGSSSELLNTLFRPTLSTDDLFKSRLFNPATGYMRLSLSDRIHPRSAADVGRIANSATAWRAAQLCHSSCIKGIASGGSPYPQGIFPFEGETDLVVSGKWLSRSGEANKTFLVYQIHSCNHPFPFKTLHHSGGAVKAKKREPENASDKKGADSVTGRSTPPKESHLEEKDPSNDLKPAVRVVNARRRFPDLDRKAVYGSKAIEACTVGRPTSLQEPIQEEAAGEPGSSERCRPISLIDAVDQVGAPPEWLSEAYRTLRALPGLDIELLTCSDADGWSIPLPLCADDDGVIDEQLLIPDGSSCKARRASAFRVLAGGRSTVLVVIEAPVFTSMAYSSSLVEEIELTEALSRAAVEYSKQRSEHPVQLRVLDFQINRILSAQISSALN
jgi:hypothetical protein